ncbi:MAG: MBL fold metallo-hydrolase [Actinomycetia bacterium]|nr:MBL fold metallo-hydrolase [Actinomycetes bacterium]
MIFEQYELGCLSISSYLIGDETTGRAVVIDPQRDIGGYVDDAEARGLKIEAVILTHFHADYVSGHLELAEQAGAEIWFGEAAEADFPVHYATDAERLVLGDVVLEVWATPGHTPESISILVFPNSDDTTPWAVLTGDAIFVGDVGRPDLLGAIGITAQELGSQLYDSVHRLAELPDEVRVYPGHSAGSACGKNLGSEPYSTIGDQKATNYALQPMPRQDFIDLVTAGQPAAPGYFLHDAITNRRDHATFDEKRHVPTLTKADADSQIKAGAVLVDTRSPADYAAGHLAGAVNVGLDGRFAETVGMVVSAETPIIVTGEPGAGHEAMVRLARIGFDEVVGDLGDLAGVMAAHPDQVVSTRRVAPAQVSADGVQLVDVRNPGETELGTFPGATIIPLAQLPGRLDELDKDQPVLAYCAGGWRSMVAVSYLASQGFGEVADVAGGYEELGKLLPAPV